MKSTFARVICRILMASLIVLPWQAQAGMIGTNVAVSGAVVNRAGLALQLEALGIPPQAARERVAALTDRELASVAGRIDQLPAGGVAGLLPVIAAVVLIWWFMAGEKDRADSGKAKK